MGGDFTSRHNNRADQMNIDAAKDGETGTLLPETPGRFHLKRRDVGEKLGYRDLKRVVVEIIKSFLR